MGMEGGGEDNEAVNKGDCYSQLTVYETINLRIDSFMFVDGKIPMAFSNFIRFKNIIL